MPNKSFERTKTIDPIIKAMIGTKEYHGTLKDFGVRIDVLFSANPLKHRGVPCYAYIKITSKKDRALGLGDAQIVVDRDKWAELSEETKTALIDHEIYHLFVATDKEGDPKEDDLGRPVLRMRSHDVEIGWFREIAAEHGDAAIEVIQARAIMEKDKQFFFAFLDETKSRKPAKPSKSKVTPIEQSEEFQSAAAKG